MRDINNRVIKPGDDVATWNKHVGCRHYLDISKHMINQLDPSREEITVMDFLDYV